MLKRIVIALIIWTYGCSGVPSGSGEATASRESASLAPTCGWVDPGCNPHVAPQLTALCVVVTGAAGVLPVGVGPCDMEPGDALRVAPGDSWATFVRESGDFTVEARPCR